MATDALPPRLFSPDFFRDPYPTYHYLRSTDPVLWEESAQAWVLTTTQSFAQLIAGGVILVVFSVFLFRHARPGDARRSGLPSG